MFLSHRLLLLASLAFFLLHLPTRGQSPAATTGTTANSAVFQVGTTGSSTYPSYATSFASVPVGKSLVIPIIVDKAQSALRFTVASNNPKIQPILKTGCPVMNIQVQYAVTTTSTTATPTTTTGTDGVMTTGTTYSVVTSTGTYGGNMLFSLLRDMTPQTTGYISGFANAGFYNGHQFFRIANLIGQAGGYIAQGGSPDDTASGGPGFSFDNEFNPSLIFTGAGQLAMANSGIDPSTYQGTNGSQFFITQGHQRDLDFNHTIFGQLVQGFDVMNKLMSVPLMSSTSSTPEHPVVMQNVSVAESGSTALLIVSASGYVPATAPATITVNAIDAYGNVAVHVSGTSGETQPGLPITIFTSSDKTLYNPATNATGVNDPPIILRDPNISTTARGKLSFPIRGQDLEYDFLIPGAARLGGTGYAAVGTAGNTAIVTPFSTGSVSTDVGLSIYQPLGQVGRQNPYDQTHFVVAEGDEKLTPAASPPVSSQASPVFQFLSSSPRVTGSNFSGSINFGDGSPIFSGSDVAITSARTPGVFNVMLSGTATHTYKNPGIYYATAAVTDTNGALLILSTPVSKSTGTITAVGRSFLAARGVVNTQLASFVDGNNAFPASKYLATINWGDGAISNGTISGGAGTFYVYGSHHYTRGLTYPVDITVSYSDSSNSTNAWSIATLSGVPTSQPPFPQAHINALLGTPGYASSRSLSEEVNLSNSGTLTSGPIQLKFFLSNSTSYDSTSVPLTVGNNATYQTVPIRANSSIQGTVSNIFIPPGYTTNGKYLLMQVITSDPVGDYMAYQRIFADSIPLF